MVLQDLMTKEYPHVREKMSLYKLDYIKELANSLTAIERMLEHAAQISQE